MVSRQARKAVLLHVHTTVHIMLLVVWYTSSRKVLPDAHKPQMFVRPVSSLLPSCIHDGLGLAASFERCNT